MVISYKCPGCGDDMAFDAESGTLACRSCGRQDKIENIPEELKTARFTEDEATEYHCQNCGAILITEKETTATSCSFCGGAAVIADRLSGSLAPAKVIPFTISKEEAADAFRKWCRKGLLTPKGFMSADRIKSITGMYVPFWMYDLNSKVQVSARCTKVHRYIQGDYIYTEIEHYDAFRDINLDYIKVPVDASEKMNDQLMDKLEPYPYDQLKDFKTAYLAGYIAEKYNYDDEELFPRAKSKISGYIESYIDSTLSGYSSVDVKTKHVDTQKVKSFYVLLPVWMVNYNYKQKDYIFAMNGQTGKVVGKPPISSFKEKMWFSGLAVSIFALWKIIAAVMGGGA
ncbi:TFIIB-type zinc ribbon-containing protein [Bacillus licheniformis]|uniref:TFIIB-type zinc ribbon-containing protein n=1 Tax=Bacillus licheniformis TaxID=1402 RepID=UPI000BE02C26|nr:hypothetical protein TY90_16825 [Bacillus licheniformis]